MWPWGHLAVGYLLYSASARLLSIEPFDGKTVALVVLGSQLPDLIDKPLAWTFHILPTGRTFAHSAFTFLICSGLVWLYYRQKGYPQRASAFAIGYLSHLIGDGYSALLSGQYASLSYLGWPFLPPPPVGNKGGFVDHFTAIQFTPTIAIGLIVSVVAYIVWIEDGAPGRRKLGAVGKRLFGG